ncbi:MAG: GNAT family N-acetyltransferase [Clostridia bacterium]|nr:GNAT family N-acetyltransferase [Clostridia bacterium]
MEFKKTKVFKIEINKEQANYLSEKSKIEKMLKKKDVLGFDVFYNKKLVGFAMLKEFDKNKFFLWDYLIERTYQGKGLGTQALRELIDLLKREYNCKLLTTTYKIGNEIGKHIYEKLGFVQTEVIDNDQIHEVNMELKF